MQEIRQCVGEVIGTFYLCFAGISAILCTQTMGSVDTFFPECAARAASLSKDS